MSEISSKGEGKLSRFEMQLGVRPRTRSGALDSSPAPWIGLIIDLGHRDDRSERASWNMQMDRDNASQVLSSRLGPMTIAIQDPRAGRGVVSFELPIHDLEDLRPERFLEHFEPARTLLHLRDTLARPGDATQAIRWLKTEFYPDTASPAATTLPKPESEVGSGRLLDAILDNKPVPLPSRSDERLSREISSLAREIAASHALPGSAAERSFWISKIDQSLSTCARCVLRDPGFRRRERAWLGITELCRSLPNDACLIVIDLRQEDSVEELLGMDDPTESRVGRAIRVPEVSPLGGHRWGGLLCDWEFTSEAAHLNALGALAKVVASTGTSLFAQGRFAFGDGTPGGCPPSVRDIRTWIEGDESQAWRRFRAAPEASHIGLLIPRVVYRVPFGRTSAPCERFDFEELDLPPEAGDLAWGSAPLFLGAHLIGFDSGLGDEAVGGRLRIPGRPLITYRTDSGIESVPCAEWTMTDECVDVIAGMGLIPVVPYLGEAAVLVGPFSSAGGPPQCL